MITKWIIVLTAVILSCDRLHAYRARGIFKNRLAHNADADEDARLPITSLIPKYGFPIEEHEVVTEDGYILTMHRIPGNGKVVFLMHGLLGSADDFIITGPDNGLAYLLAREGYDVWLGNARGTKHSRRHEYLTPFNARFWNFSWHEIGIYDLPAMIDSILAKTGQTSIKYIGHSQGTTSFFVMASERPEYNDKISLMIALSPVAYMSHVRSPMRMYAPGMSMMSGMHEYWPNNDMMTSWKLRHCGNRLRSICSNTMFMMNGFDVAQMDEKNLPVLLGHTPSGASAKQFVHYSQLMVSGQFRQFNYGVGNFYKYGSWVPPSYPLEKISAPVALIYSEDDWFAHPIDVEALHNRLKNTIEVYKVPRAKFSHMDYLYAKDFKALLYTRIKKLMKL